MSETFFIDGTKRRNIINIFPNTQFTLSNDFNSIKTIEKCTITLEKADNYNLIQLRLMDTNDPTKMFICTVDNFLYEQIKAEQTLHVSFQDFIMHLTKILDCCKKEELLMSLLKDDQKFHIQFYERRSFRNLIHLYLPVREASMETILFHINSSYNSIQDHLRISNTQNNRLQIEISHRDEHVNQLQNEIKRLNDLIKEQDNLVFNRNCEDMNKLQQTIKHLQDSKESEEKKYKMIINQMQEQIDSFKRENLSLTDRLTQESIKVGTIRDELNSYKINNNTIRERNERLQAELVTIQTREKKHEMILSENRRLIQDLNDKAHRHDKQLADVRAEMEAEKSICNTKRNALIIATEEISKANGIIKKQSKEINELRKDIDIRTQVALKQEIHVKEKEKESTILKQQLITIQEEYEKNLKNRNEFEILLKNLTANADRIEEQYKQKIKELQYRIINSSDNNANRYTNLPSTSSRHLKLNGI